LLELLEPERSIKLARCLAPPGAPAETGRRSGSYLTLRKTASKAVTGVQRKASLAILAAAGWQIRMGRVEIWYLG
jgi:hypothetical protein